MAFYALCCGRIFVVFALFLMEVNLFLNIIFRTVVRLLPTNRNEALVVVDLCQMVVRLSICYVMLKIVRGCVSQVLVGQCLLVWTIAGLGPAEGKDGVRAPCGKPVGSPLSVGVVGWGG